MEHLKILNKDKELKKIIRNQPIVQLQKKKPVYAKLVASIISQQLSTKVADVIHGRFLALFPASKPTPEQILQVPYESLRAIGLSHAKTTYVQNVCRFFIEENIQDRHLERMDDELLIDYLTQIKGVGRWTVEMILMFSMARPDVFAADDLGIQQAMIRLYNLDASDKKTLKLQMLEKAASWRPYRTYACRYLWAWKDQK